MAGLEIPERVWAVLPLGRWEDGFTAAAKIVVAAELRRMLDEDEWPCRCWKCIRNRADELDPGGADNGLLG